MDKNKIWGTTLNFLRDNNTSLSYNTWLAPLTIHHIEEDAGIIYLAWPNQAKLIITVDNGISSIEAVKFINGFKKDVIITDHHEAPEEQPPAYAIINPKAAWAQR